MDSQMVKKLSVLKPRRTKKARILLRGLDASGKTTILYKLNRPNEKLLIIPTIGFNVETVTTVDNIFTMWDVGGGDKIKPLLVNYFPGTDGVMFSIDSTDVSRMEEAKEELFWILLHEEMTPGCPVVVFANKQDLPNAQSADKIIEGLGLKELTNNPWHLQETYAITGDGLYEGVEKMATMLKEFQEERS